MAVEYDFFIAHSAADAATAERLFELLSPESSVFLDSRCLLLGDDSDRALPAAQRRSKVTVVLVSSRTGKAFYQREEIAAAIALARKDPASHRVVPIFLNGPPDEVGDVPYGLRLKHGIVLSGKTTLATATARLLDLRQRLAPARESAARAEAVTVLHLSGTRFDRLHDDLARSSESHGLRPDLLVVSGDLAESGMRSEFEQALTFLEQLSAYLGLPRRHVVIVPGNHDVNRKACQAYFSRCDADEEEPLWPFWPKWRHFSSMFHEFYRDELSVRFEVDQPWTLFEMADLRVVVAGLNSTMADSHRDEDHHGHVGQAQLRWFADRLATFEERGWLRIGVVHHHPLRDAADLERILAPRLNLVVHGHEAADQHEVLQIRSDRITRWAGDQASETRQTLSLVHAAFACTGEPGPGIDLPRTGDDFLDRVAEVCALHQPEAAIIRAGEQPLEYLRVTTVGRQYPVGAYEQGVDTEAVERFVERVHHTFRTADPGVTSELVYGGPPAPPALVEQARRRGVRLVSFIEYQGVLDLRGCVARQTERLERDRIYPPQLYVPQRYRLIERRETQVEHDLLGRITQWLAETPCRFVLALGDFGAGKTFLLHELARRLPSELPDLVPLLLELRTLEKARTVEELAAQHLTAQGEPFDPERFRYMLREGRVVLLFDGFDELAFRVTYERVTEHLKALLDAADGRAKLVVTSRGEHFVSDEQVRTALGERVELLGGRRLVRLEGFDDGQIRAFLVNLFDGDEARAEARLELIHDVRDLLGLSRNPRMLSFIADLEEQALLQARERHGAITSAELYRLLLTRWLEHEYRRAQPRGGAPTLSVDERWRAVTGLALRLWHTTERSVRLSDLQRAAGEVIADMADRLLDEDQAAHVVGSGTLLVRDEEGSFAFVHQSVMEWLVANHAAEQLESDPVALSRRELSALMTDFLCGLAGRARARAWARDVLSTAAGVETAKRNALLVLDRLGERAEPGAQLQGQDLRGKTFSSAQDLSGADLRGADLTDARLVGVSLTGANLAGARLIGARLDRANLSRADLTGADLTGAWLLGADLRGAVLTASVWRRARLIGARVDPGALDGCDTWGAALPDVDRVELQTDPGSAPCAAVAFSPDSELLVSGGDDGVVRVWEAASGELVRGLEGHTGQVQSVAFSPDGRWLVSAGTDQVVRLWNAASGRLIRPLQGHAGSVRSVAFSPDGRRLASAADDRLVRVWDAASGRLIRPLLGHAGAVRSVGFSPDGRWLASAGHDGAVRLWNAASGEPIRALENRTDWVSSVVFSPDSRWLAFADADGAVQVWDVASGLLLHALESGTDQVLSVAFSPDGRWLASASHDRTVRIRDADNGELIRTLQGHTGPVRSVGFSPDGRWLASASADATVRIWEPVTGELIRTLQGHTNRVHSLAFSANSRQLAAASTDATVRIWNPASGKPIHTLTGHAGPVRSVAFSPDSRQLASAGNDRVVRVWDAASGALIHTLTGHARRVRGVAFSPDSRWLATAADDQTVRIWIWDAPSGKPIHTLTGHAGAVRGVAFSPDGRRLASAGNDRTVRIWNPASGKLVRALIGHQDRVRSVAFNHDSRWLASAGADGTVRIWNPANGELIRTLPGHTGAVRSVAFNRDSRWLASAGDDRAVRVWDPASGELIRTLQDHTGPVRSVAFSRDGRWLASAGADGTVWIWDPASGELAVTLIPLPEGWAALTPGGGYKLEGLPAGAFWYVAGMCRFEPGELDEFLPALRRLPPDAPLLPPAR